MNGEMQQICMLVHAARNALTLKEEFQYLSEDYTDSITFHFLSQKFLFHQKSYVAANPKEWFQHCIQNDVCDMKFLTPLSVPDKKLLGFANVNQSTIVTFHKNDLVTNWIATWTFDQALKKWKVTYKEYQWDNPPAGKPAFENNKEKLEDILFRISEFADRIGFQGFGDVFRNAHDILNGKIEIPTTYPSGSPIYLPNVDEEKKRMFSAASAADVFGAMGSWNDSPPWYAQEMGLEDEYESLSDELLWQIRMAALYVINEG